MDGRAGPEESAIAFAAVADTLRAARRAEPALWEAARAGADRHVVFAALALAAVLFAARRLAQARS